jgi:hypothetical protein
VIDWLADVAQIAIKSSIAMLFLLITMLVLPEQAVAVITAASKLLPTF